jgi:hypothetical protein
MYSPSSQVNSTLFLLFDCYVCLFCRLFIYLTFYFVFSFDLFYYSDILILTCNSASSFFFTYFTMALFVCLSPVSHGLRASRISILIRIFG